MPHSPGADRRDDDGADARRHGIVRKTVGGVYDVEIEGGDVVEAVLRGRLKQEKRAGDRVVAGDRVEVERQADGAFTIEAVADRRTQLARRAPGPGARRAKVIVANIDQLAVMFAVARPRPNLRMLDRFLVLAEANALAAVVLVNKIDLRENEADARAQFGVYERIGYPVLYLSLEDGRGVDDAAERLCGRTSVLAGPSGVGKSSLLNLLEPGLDRRVGEVGTSTRKGRHTTVAVELIPLGCGGYVADTPGLRELGLWGVPLEELDACFPEFEPYLGTCRFGYRCSHTHEPGCSIREAVEAGEISADRYESYCAILESEESERR